MIVDGNSDGACAEAWEEFWKACLRYGSHTGDAEETHAIFCAGFYAGLDQGESS